MTYVNKLHFVVYPVVTIGYTNFLFAQHGYNLTGASPEAALIVGRLQPKARVSVATRNLKEAGGKHLV